MSLRLPPLSSLRLFEAAGRLGSFKKAASELNVTPSAVSHGIVGLEQALGVELFLREPRKMVLTAEGADRRTLIDANGRVNLGGAVFIHVSSVSEDWQAWLDASEASEIVVNTGLRFDTTQLAFEAAVAGLGVALGRKPLVDRDLASGALVVALPEIVPAKTAYWLVSSEAADRRPDLLEFRDWMMKEALLNEPPLQRLFL